MNRLQISLIAIFVGLLSQPAIAGESAYTKIDLENGCTFHSEYELGASAYCDGYKGYPVHFSEGDLRQMVRFGHIEMLENQWESFGQFNRINDTIEWRLADGSPYAAILRWFIENSNDNGEIDASLEGQVLVISSVADHASPKSCVTGYVDARANRNANELARQVADTVTPGFRCGEDIAKFHGERGTFSGDVTRSFE